MGHEPGLLVEGLTAGCDKDEIDLVVGGLATVAVQAINLWAFACDKDPQAALSELALAIAAKDPGGPPMPDAAPGEPSSGFDRSRSSAEPSRSTGPRSPAILPR